MVDGVAALTDPSTHKPKIRTPAAKRATAVKSHAKTAMASRRPAAKRVSAKKAVARKPKLWRSDAEGYMVYESSVEPRHFSVEQIRRAVKAVAGR